jgi:mannosyltransferase OCH1-like enzyme
MDRIPKIIHLICAAQTPPARYAVFIDKMKQLHPSWEFNIWDDERALSIVQEYFPELEAMYTAYTLPVQRADILRVIVTYLMGGFYMDLDMLCLKNLDSLCANELVLGVEKTLTWEECVIFGHRYNVRIANYMFGSRPRHKFWLDFLVAAKARAGLVIHGEADVLETTGPGLLTKVFHEKGYRHRNITLLSNEEKPCRKACGPASCHFGDYAVHLHMGSWRWEDSNQN